MLEPASRECGWAPLANYPPLLLHCICLLSAPLLVQAEPETGPGWFLQRYFVCDEYWRRPQPSSSSGGSSSSSASSSGSSSSNSEGAGPIFFYVGNEADVEL